MVCFFEKSTKKLEKLSNVQNGKNNSNTIHGTLLVRLATYNNIAYQKAVKSLELK
jgi:hypothetical protein